MSCQMAGLGGSGTGTGTAPPPKPLLSSWGEVGGGGVNSTHIVIVCRAGVGGERRPVLGRKVRTGWWKTFTLVRFGRNMYSDRASSFPEDKDRRFQVESCCTAPERKRFRYCVSLCR